MNTYRALSPAAEGMFAAGVFEHEFTVLEERDALDAGLVEIVPRPYRVLTDNFAAAPQGETFEAAFPVETETALIAAGHIERVKPTAVKPSTTKSTAKKTKE